MKTKKEIKKDNYLSSRVEAHFTQSKTGKQQLQSISIGGKAVSPESREDVQKFFNAMEEIGGGLDPEATIDFIAQVSSHFPEGMSQSSFNRVASLLQKMQPKDPVEARLLAQHFILHEQGMKYLERFSNTDILPQSQHLGTLSIKMIKLSQESIQALTKYRNKGTQQINIVHMQDNAKAVVMGGA